MQLEFVRIDKVGHIATVTLNRPDHLNALSRTLMQEIETAALSFLYDEETRVVIFAGEGKHFSAGADLNERNTPAPSSLLLARRTSGLGSRMIKAIHNMNQVTIAAVHGVAAGGGACIAAACDFRLGADDARIGYPEVKLGMNLMWGAVPHCIHLIGPARAKRMIMKGDFENAQTLLDWGFLDEVMPRAELLVRAQQMAAEYVARPPIAVQMIKQSINAVSGALDAALMHMDTDQNLLTASTDDLKEGITSFLEKRDPTFTGN